MAKKQKCIPYIICKNKKIPYLLTLHVNYFNFLKDTRVDMKYNSIFRLVLTHCKCKLFLRFCFKIIIMLNCCVLVCMFQPEIAFFSQNRGGTSSIHTHLGPRRRGSPGKSTQGGRAGGSGNRGATVTGASCRPPTPPRAHALAWLKSLA